MTRRWIIVGCAAFLLAACATVARQRPVCELVSPDGRFRAVVVPLGNAPHGAGESRVELHAADGTTLLARSYASEDGEHGLGIERASWTPDSRFFVYSLSSSGGHQPWHAPIHFVAVSGPALEALDDSIGPIGDSNFIVKAPDVVRTTVVQPEDLSQRAVEVSLAELTRRGAAGAEQAAPPDRARAHGG